MQPVVPTTAPHPAGAEAPAGLSPPAGPRLVLAHVGRLERQRFTDECVRGFQQFSRANRAASEQLELRIVGQANPMLVSRLREGELRTTVTGYVGHQRAIRHMLEADVLLLPSAHGAHAHSLIPAKAFEYLASGRLVWFIGAAECEAWQRILAAGAGIRCDPDAPAIAATLSHLVRLKLEGALPGGCSIQALQRYTRERLTRELIEVFEQVLAARNGCTLGNVAQPSHERRARYADVRAVCREAT